MTQHLDQLKTALLGVQSAIRIRADSISRLKWELDELRLRQTELLQEIEREHGARVNPCLERVL